MQLLKKQASKKKSKNAEDGKKFFLWADRGRITKKAWCDEVLENAKTHLGVQIATINSLFILSVGGWFCSSWWKKIVIR